MQWQQSHTSSGPHDYPNQCYGDNNAPCQLPVFVAFTLLLIASDCCLAYIKALSSTLFIVSNHCHIFCLNGKQGFVRKSSSGRRRRHVGIQQWFPLTVIFWVTRRGRDKVGVPSKRGALFMCDRVRLEAVIKEIRYVDFKTFDLRFETWMPPILTRRYEPPGTECNSDPSFTRHSKNK